MAVGNGLNVTTLQAQALLNQKDKVINALSMFRPTETQEEFFRTFSMDMILEILLGGGNRCLAGCQEIYDPVKQISRRVDSIDGDFHVESKNPENGEDVIGLASRPFIKGYGDFYRISLSNGQSIVTTLGHRLLCTDGEWREVGVLLQASSPVPLASTSDTFLSGFSPDGPCCTRIVQGSRWRYSGGCHHDDERPPLGPNIDRDEPPSQVDAQECSGDTCKHVDDSLCRSSDIHPCLSQRHPSSSDFLVPEGIRPYAVQNHCGDRLCSRRESSETWGRLLRQAYQQFAAVSSRLARTIAAYLQSANSTFETLLTSKTIFIDSAQYHSTGPIWDLTVHNWNNYSISGILNHNSGKSTCASVGLASFMLNQPVTFRDGSQHYMRPERWRSEAVKIWIIGYDWKHLSKTIYRLLFKRDLFRVIRDQSTGKWRTWNPNLPEDADLFHVTRASPPLLRASDIIGGEEGISWENKKERQVSAFDLVHDNSRVEFFASTGSKPQGDPAHLIWMDEKIEDESWYSELLVRLIDYRGRLLWTTWPTTAPSAAMSEASERAELQIGAIDRTSFSFVLKGSDNPYTKSIHRDKIFATMDEDTRAARDEGKLGTERWRVYARFSRFVHRVLSNDPGGDDALAKTVREANGIPGDWTRYLILDPGTANPAVLMVAIPPPKLGDFVVPYDELYLHYTPAKQLAEAIAAKTKGTFFEDFIIDAHAARQTPMGFDGTIGANYEKEFAAQKLRCRRHGNRFSFGSDNVTGRILRLQGLMNIRGSDGQPTLRVLTSGCPNLIKQLEQYKWQPDPKGNPTDQPAKYQKIDLANCLEYLVSRDDCSYVKPPEQKVADGRSPKEVLKHIRSFFSRDEKVKADDQSVYCGAGARPSY